MNGCTAQVVYASSDQADLAFNTISTTAQEDTSGRLQKKIYIATDGKKHIMVSLTAGGIPKQRPRVLRALLAQ